MAMFNLKEETNKNIIEVGKFAAAVVVAFVAVLAWLDGRFMSAALADDFAKKEKVKGLERIVKFQEFNYISDKIVQEEKKPKPDQNKAKIDSFYKQKSELKKELGL